MNNSALDRLHARQARVRQEIAESQARMRQLVAKSRQRAASGTEGLGRAATWVERARMIYNGVRVGLRVAAVVRALWPRHKRRRKR